MTFGIRIAGGLCALALLAGCADASPNARASVTSPSGFAQYSVVEDARADGASDAQIALLAEADETGTMSYETAVKAIEESFACFDDSGVPHSTVSKGAGGDPSYTFSAVPGLSDEETLAIANACLHENSYWVEMYFQLQPAAVEEEERLRALAHPLIVACLEAEGIAVDPDLPVYDLIRFAHEPANIANKDCVFEAFKAVGLA